MQFFKNLKTSQKISYSFLAFQALFLLLLLFAINIIYFFIWYSELKKESLYDMNMNYKSYSSMESISNREAFKEYILTKNTIITPNAGKTICSNSVTNTLHNDESKVGDVKNSLFYSVDGKTYIVVTRKYDQIGTVSVLHDTTEYVNSQMIIIKISILLILLFLVFGYFFGKKMVDSLLKNLKSMAKKVQEKELGNTIAFPKYGKKDDEIQVVATALETAFSKIEQQANTQQQFLTDVAHEFKTPLMSMSSKLDLFEKTLQVGKSLNQTEVILYTKKQVAKLNNLLETLMLLSKLEDGDISENMKSLNLSNILKNICSEMKHIFPEKDIHYNINIGQKQTLQADEVLGTILLQNLIGNAIKFAEKSVEIDVSLKNSILKITDNGPGIAKEQLSTIWDKFSRLDTNREGFGIGLFLVKRICKLHNWNISVESELGEGTTFSIDTHS